MPIILETDGGVGPISPLPVIDIPLFVREKRNRIHPRDFLGKAGWVEGGRYSGKLSSCAQSSHLEDPFAKLAELGELVFCSPVEIPQGPIFLSLLMPGSQTAELSLAPLPPFGLYIPGV